MIDLTGSVVLVTGAGSAKGIGAALVLAYAKAGANIVINYRSDTSVPAVNKLAEMVKAIGGDVLIAKADVTISTDVKEMFTSIMGKFGRIDTVVNNAGITKDMLLLRMKEQDFTDVVDTNLKSAFIVSKAAMSIMLKQKSGNIINMSSIVGLTGNAGQVNYAASKAGLIGMTKSMAKELAGRNIRVNAIAPGFIVSDMTDKLSEEQKLGITQMIPMKKIGEAEAVANAAVFLSSDLANYITGQVLSVDGGLHM
ncbi:3-oxoacyl-[acyl-carrier-protein] reductase [Erysipelotrichaceae bacterium]|nr:3-oxoacyl-[acyl-carrier-protein] reductase [Erysipelotrichaceae bacterium]